VTLQTITLAFLLLNFSHRLLASDQDACDLSRLVRYDFRNVLSRHGLDADKIRFKTQEMSPGGLVTSLDLEYGAPPTRIGGLIFRLKGRKSKPSDAYIGGVGLDADFRGKGLGTLLHLLVAMKMYKQYGLLLRNDGTQTSQPMWQSLEKYYMADPLSPAPHTRLWRFRKDYLEKAENEELWQFFLERGGT
jgi:hypothetical protein